MCLWGLHQLLDLNVHGLLHDAVHVDWYFHPFFNCYGLLHDFFYLHDLFHYFVDVNGLIYVYRLFFLDVNRLVFWLLTHEGPLEQTLEFLACCL